MASIREINQNDDTFVGIKLPFRFGTTGFFNQSKTVKEQAFSNLKNLILTIKGERVGQPEFGCGVHRIIFEPITETTSDSIEAAVRDAVSNWLPYISIHNVYVSIDDQDANTILLSLEYSVDVEDPDSVESISFNFNVGI
jgi:phage baseplate assembly protein W|tara:strand:+ start:442 stop:861 length:420 start_codon:yes stop_codon:yes gene_type:complete